MSSTTRGLGRFRHGIWTDNPGLVQLLGLCPLLAVTTTLVNGMGLGVATLLVLTCSNVLVSATRKLIRPEIRIPMYVLIISSLVTCVEMIFLAWFPALGRSLGIFIPLIVTNCTIVARAEVFASRHPVPDSLLDGLTMGSGFALLLTAIGAFRELIGQGTGAAQKTLADKPELADKIVAQIMAKRNGEEPEETATEEKPEEEATEVAA